MTIASLKLIEPLTEEQKLVVMHAKLSAENDGGIHAYIQTKAFGPALTRIRTVVRDECRAKDVRATDSFRVHDPGSARKVSVAFLSRVAEAVLDVLADEQLGVHPKDRLSLHYFISYEELLKDPIQQPEVATIPPTISINAQAALDELNRLIESDTPPKFLPLDQINSQDSTMTNDITIVNQTLINGKPLSSYSDSQVYDLIAQAEKKIADLEAIKTKPARLKKEIADRRAALDALIKVLDDADPKSDLPAAIA